MLAQSALVIQLTNVKSKDRRNGDDTGQTVCRRAL
jgi:hypothetical protein